MLYLIIVLRGKAPSPKAGQSEKISNVLLEKMENNLLSITTIKNGNSY